MADSKRNSSEQNSTVSDYVDAEESSSAQKRRAIENVLSDAFLSTVNSTMESPSCVSDDLAIIEPSSPPKRRAIKTLLPAVRRNPRRAVPIRNYFEGNKPSVLPKNSYKASLEDNPVPVGSTDRARKTVPRRILAVRYSNIHGYGVFAVKNLKTGIRMGPYEGIRTEVKTETGYAWALSDGTFIDASDETTSNYLRFVNCARTEKEENLEAFEFNGELYYKTKKNIVKGEELLIFYGVSFAKHLGIDMKKYYSEEGAKIVSRPSSRRKSTSTSESESRVECRSIKSLIEIQCEDCEYKSWDPEDMANHRVAEHEDENSTWYSCSLCDFHTCSRADLGRHSNSHIL